MLVALWGDVVDPSGALACLKIGSRDGTAGRFHALVQILPVKIAAYSSGSNGMRTKFELPVRDPTTTPCRLMISTIAVALALSRSSASVTSRRSLLYRSGWAVLMS